MTGYVVSKVVDFVLVRLLLSTAKYIERSSIMCIRRQHVKLCCSLHITKMTYRIEQMRLEEDDDYDLLPDVVLENKDGEQSHRAQYRTVMGEDSAQKSQLRHGKTYGKLYQDNFHSAICLRGFKYDVWKFIRIKRESDINKLCRSWNVGISETLQEDDLCFVQVEHSFDNAVIDIGTNEVLEELKCIYESEEKNVKVEERKLRSHDEHFMEIIREAMERFRSSLYIRAVADRLRLTGCSHLLDIALEELNAWDRFTLDEKLLMTRDDGVLSIVNLDLAKWHKLLKFHADGLANIDEKNRFEIAEWRSSVDGLCHLIIRPLDASSTDWRAHLYHTQLKLSCLLYDFRVRSFACSRQSQQDPEFKRALEIVLKEYGDAIDVVHEEQEVLIYGSRCTASSAIRRLMEILGDEKVKELVCPKIPKDYHQLWEEADLNIWEYVVQVKLKDNDKLRQNLKFYVQSGEEETCAVYYLVLDDGQKRAHYLQDVQRFYELAKDNVVLKTVDHRLYATYSSELEETLSMFHNLAVRETHTEIIFIGCPPIPIKALRMFQSLVPPPKRKARVGKCKGTNPGTSSNSSTIFDQKHRGENALKHGNVRNDAIAINYDVESRHIAPVDGNSYDLRRQSIAKQDLPNLRETQRLQPEHKGTLAVAGHGPIPLIDRSLKQHYSHSGCTSIKQSYPIKPKTYVKRVS